MSRMGLVSQFLELVQNVKNEAELFLIMEEVTSDIGFHHFALINHVDFRRSPSNAIQLYNYPRTWSEYFIENGLHAHDPILLASLTSTVGFAWTEVPTMIRITKQQRKILDCAARHGLGNGFTVPAHIPGNVHGSCSFAMKFGVEIPECNIHVAQLVGAFAFQAAHRLSQSDSVLRRPFPQLTPRQQDCLLWAIRGKTDWEIGQILGLKEETVTEYLNSARERYGVAKRLPLAIRAIFDGQISFIEALF